MVINLPVARGTGDVYKFLNTVARTSGTIIINASATSTPSNVFVGTIAVVAGSNAAAASNLALAYFTSTDDIITLNITTTGGGWGGDYLELVDGAAARWYVINSRFVGTTGNSATPFSGAT
jgi:hypothetical protein